MRKRVVVTGIGWITPLGLDIESVWKRLLHGDSGMAPTTLFDARTFPTNFSAEVKGYDFAATLGDSYDRHKDAGRNTQFSLGAALQAWKMSGLPLPRGAKRNAINTPDSSLRRPPPHSTPTLSAPTWASATAA